MRSSWCRIARLVAVIVLLSVVWLQLALPPLPNDPPNSTESLEGDPSLAAHHSPVAKFLKAIRLRTDPPRQTVLSYEQIQDIREQIVLKNENETIINEELFGPVQPDTVVIVIQVHNRLEYLRHLIVSLAQARDIETVLLIFSHDYYDEDINKLITTIDFCKVMQIFYPHTLQTHPYSFPGETKGDCPRDTTTQQASEVKCVGNPDLYGHYREARYTQTKHHWWWKTNKIFDSMATLRNHTGLVMFLEEDHYVTEDFLYLLRLLHKVMPQACPKCSLITLGNYLKNYNFKTDAKKVEVGPWISSKHNMGFAFNRTVWQQIKSCGEPFCSHDDYNWDWSLQHISGTCLPKRIFTMVARAPRVFHIGLCGVHHKKKDCNSRLILNKVYRTIQGAQHTLFPKQIVVIHAPIKKFKKHKGNGGWGDKRDHALCHTFSESTAIHNPALDALVRDPLDTFPSNLRNYLKDTKKNTSS